MHFFLPERDVITNKQSSDTKFCYGVKNNLKGTKRNNLRDPQQNVPIYCHHKGTSTASMPDQAYIHVNLPRSVKAISIVRIKN